MKNYNATITTVRSGAPGMSLGMSLPGRRIAGGLLLLILSILLIEEGGL